MTLKISISGVRGLVPESLTPEICLDFAKAFGTYLSKGAMIPKVVIGTDSRASSEFIKGIVFSGLLSTGCEVIDLGICPTPTVGIMVKKTRASGGLVITASHNPLPWNGLKFMREDGIFLNESQAKKLISIYENKNFNRGTPETVKTDASAIPTHLEKVLKTVNPYFIRLRRFRVALDSCNGAGSKIGVELLKKLGCRVEAINCDTSIPFPHPPEPVPENLGGLIRLVKTKKADIGFAFDSDADRLAIVDENGRPVGEELTLALCTKFILFKYLHENSKKKIVITNLSTTKAIDDIVNCHNGTVIRTKIGEVHVAEELKNLKGLIGGEGNGGVIYPAVCFNRDAMTAMALILSFMAGSRKSISKIISELPAYFMLKEKIQCKSLEEAEEAVEKIKQLFKGRSLILTDGVKVILPDGWVHVRSSNTEPIIRVIAECRGKKEAKALVQKVLHTLR